MINNIKMATNTSRLYHIGDIIIYNLSTKGNQSLDLPDMEDRHRSELGFSPECVEKARLGYMVLLVIIVCAGVIGNAISLIVLYFQSRSSNFNFLIIVLSCVDIITLLLLPIERLMYKQYSTSLALIAVNLYVVDKAIGLARLASVWMLIVIAFFRFMAVCVPMKVKLYCTYKNAKRCVVAVFVLDTLVHLPFYFAEKVSLVPNTTDLYQRDYTSWGMSNAFVLYGDVIYTTVYFFALPFLSLIFFSISMVRTLYGSQREKYFSLPHLKHEASDVTKVVIAIIIAFLVSYTPYLIWTVDTLIPGRREQLSSGGCSILVYRYTLDLFLYINSSINFFIYLLFRKQFRNSVKRLFRCCCCCKNKEMRPRPETVTLTTETSQ